MRKKEEEEEEGPIVHKAPTFEGFGRDGELPPFFLSFFLFLFFWRMSLRLKFVTVLLGRKALAITPRPYPHDN